MCLDGKLPSTEDELRCISTTRVVLFLDTISVERDTERKRENLGYSDQSLITDILTTESALENLLDNVLVKRGGSIFASCNRGSAGNQGERTTTLHAMGL